MRLRLKRAMFDGERLHGVGVADVSDLLVPPRDAEVWDGKEFVPVPTNKDGTVDEAEARSVMGDVPKEEEDDDFDFLDAPARPRVKKGK